MVASNGAARYAAFISYSHKDAAAARALHRRLESYRVPRRLVGTPGDHGPVPARLTPIFRDRDELPAAGDLSATVRAALAASDSLIVLCSPRAAASLWVAREIEAFRELNPGRPVLAAIVEGEPADCFPEVLSAGGAIEPLAADLRRAGDGRRLGFLKLVAGLTGVGLDALVQRDAARAIRRVTAVTLTALAATLVMAVLTVIALGARREAELQRMEAEKLVTFMLGELRRELKGVGRLDAMTGTNRAVLDYYERQPFDSLPPASRLKLAQALLSAGENDATAGKIDKARERFGRAHRISAALLAEAPADPERIFAHAQSEFWIGSIDYGQSEYASAKHAFERYRALAYRLVEIDPRNPAWLEEAAYAEGNLCTIALAKPVDVPGALAACRNSLDRMEIAARHAQDPATYRTAIANRQGWLADALRAAGDVRGALGWRHRQLALTKAQLADDPRNVTLKAKHAWVLRAIADIEGELGRPGQASALLAQVVTILEELLRIEPKNSDWRTQLIKVRGELKQMQMRR